jgi:cell shape-determining protein MreD
MLEPTGAPIPPSASPQGTNPWIIVIVVVVLLCCFCVGAIGLLFAFGGPILNELGLLHSLVPALII